MNEERPKLRIRVSGKQVGEARLDADDLARLLLNLQQAVSRTGELLYGEQASGGSGRKKAEVEKLCRLVFVDWQAGSAVPVLEFERPSGQLSVFGHIGEQSAKALIDGLSGLNENSASLPAGIDIGVLEAIEKLGRKLGSEFDSLELEFGARASKATARYDKAKRDVVRQWLELPATEDTRTVVGRLEDLLGHNRRVAVLYEPDGKKWECHFSEEHISGLGSSWLGLVRLHGRAHIEDDRRTLVVEGPVMRVDPIGSTPANQTGISHTLEEEARIQGFRPFQDANVWLKSFPRQVLEEGEADLYETVMSLRVEERLHEREAG